MHIFINKLGIPIKGKLSRFLILKFVQNEIIGNSLTFLVSKKSCKRFGIPMSSLLLKQINSKFGNSP